MQPTTFITILTAAMTAYASPALRARTGGGDGGDGGDDGSSGGACSTNEQPVCCDGILGVLSCAVSVIGGNCNGDSFCCETDAPAGALVNIEALNCVSI